MNHFKNIDNISKMIFIFFLIVSLSFFGITMIDNIKQLIENRIDSFKLYIYIGALLRNLLIEILIGFAFFGVMQVVGKRLIQR